MVSARLAARRVVWLPGSDGSGVKSGLLRDEETVVHQVAARANYHSAPFVVLQLLYSPHSLGFVY